MSGYSWLQKLECRGGTIFILAMLSVLVMGFIGAACVLKPEAVFDGGARQVFWLGIASQLAGGLTTSFSGTRRDVSRKGQDAKPVE